MRLKEKQNSPANYEATLEELTAIDEKGLPAKLPARRRLRRPSPSVWAASTANGWRRAGTPGSVTAFGHWIPRGPSALRR